MTKSLAFFTLVLDFRKSVDQYIYFKLSTCVMNTPEKVIHGLKKITLHGALLNCLSSFEPSIIGCALVLPDPVCTYENCFS